jgi:hypothetical protein
VAPLPALLTSLPFLQLGITSLNVQKASLDMLTLYNYLAPHVIDVCIGRATRSIETDNHRGMIDKE